MAAGWNKREGDGPVEFAVPWQVKGLVDGGVEQIPAADPEVGLLWRSLAGDGAAKKQAVARCKAI